MTKKSWIKLSEGWGVFLLPSMRLKDLPADLRIASETHLGALYPFKFESGSFWFLLWGRDSPLYEYEIKEQIKLEPGDFLIELPDGGITYKKQARTTNPQLLGKPS